ncbi:L-aminoadipate-semialdehyde dehydrogenase [Botrytis cinerea]
MANIFAQYGRRLPPALLDEIAAEDPERVLYSIARTENMRDGFRDINYKTVANAVNRCAHWLRQTLGTEKSRVFCYLGPLDPRYMILVMAAPKAGHIAFFTSHRNSLEAHISLVQRTGCSALLQSNESLPIARRILQGWPMEKITTPNLDYFLDEQRVDPVPITYGSYGGMDSQLLIPSLGHKPTFLSYVQGKRVFFALPVFHAASLNWTVGIALFAGVICVLPPPLPLTADLASQIFQYSDSYGAIMAPSLVIDCYNNDKYCVKMLQNLKFIVYGGGMIPEEIGDLLDDPRDWEYISLSPLLGYTFKDDRDGLGNLTIIREKEYELHQGVFSTFPHKEEHSLGDLFEPHPLKPGLWRFRARADDIISFTTAEKLNPSTMESTIQANPLVLSAVIGGQGQFQASLLLEPREYPQNSTEEQAFLDQVWPSIVQANRNCPAHGRIMKGFVMLTDPAKPLPRASKDTVQRHAVFKLYETEWKSLYERLARSTQSSKKPVVESSIFPENAHEKSSEANNSAVLSDKMALAIEAIVEQKISAALERFVSALGAETNQFICTGSSIAYSVSKETKAPGEEVLLSERSIGTVFGVQNMTNAEVLQSKSFGKTANDHTKDMLAGRLRQIIYNILAENLEVEDLKDDTDLFEIGVDSLQVLSLLDAINAFIVKCEQPVELIDKEAIYSNSTVAGLVALIIN